MKREIITVTMFDNLSKDIRFLFKGRRLFEELKLDVDRLRCRLEVPRELFDGFYSARGSAEYQDAYEKSTPLVTVCIATYNRGRLLVDRSIASVLNQTYSNIELIVVGDCCTDDTVELVSAIKDPRLRFLNLPKRGQYPENPHHQWCVAGTSPINHGLGLGQGEFITHLDDDDEFLPDRIEKLVAFTKKGRHDLVWHPFWHERHSGRWVLNKAKEFAGGSVTTSSVFYHKWFKAVPWDIEAYRSLEPGDWNRFRKFAYLGAQVARYPEPLLRHYREKNQR